MNKWDSQSACFSINPICLDAYCSIIAKYCAEYDYEGDNENYDFFISFNANTFFYWYYIFVLRLFISYFFHISTLRLFISYFFHSLLLFSIFLSQIFTYFLSAVWRYYILKKDAINTLVLKNNHFLIAILAIFFISLLFFQFCFKSEKFFKLEIFLKTNKNSYFIRILLKTCKIVFNC